MKNEELRIRPHPLLALACLVFLFAGCSKKENPPPVPPVSSAHGDTLSHHHGENCFTCHKSGGSGRVWVVAGSVFMADLTTPSPNGTLYFWSGLGGTGTLFATLPVDAKGNFYTTASILPGTGSYPQIRGTSGDIKNMPIQVPTGNCNSCHGGPQHPIWVN